MEIKEGPYPTTAEEKKLAREVTELQILINKAMDPWMCKRRTKILERLSSAHVKFFSLLRWLRSDDLEPVKRKYLIAGIVYNRRFEFDPFRIVKIETESVWDELKKSIGKENIPKVEKLRARLAAFVEPVCLEFIK